jgi:uncharacterized phage protein (TIGR02218 family)
MSGVSDTLDAHLQSGRTTLCHAWALTRADGVVMGFTDHDRSLRFDGITFKAETGLSAYALQQSTGLSVDNTEALGALSDAGLTEADIKAGRFDGAEVQAWLVNWADVTQRVSMFRGHIGELRRAGGAFEAELRGLTDVLNQPEGRVFQKPCGAVLGDGACTVDLDQPAYRVDLPVEEVGDGRVLRFATPGGLDAYAPGWFAFGQLRVLDGAAEGLLEPIKRDAQEDEHRVIELWHPLRAPLSPGDLVRLEAGCDKQAATCRTKFANFVNFQGFPDLPGDDWTYLDPGRAGEFDGGSRR